MLRIAVLETLIRYQTLIKTFHSAYGPVCWALLYQAETRMRLEQFERILRRGELQHAAAMQPQGAPTDFDPNMPWEWVFEQAVECEHTFWTDEFERPEVFVKTKIDKIADHLGADAAVDSAQGGRAGSSHDSSRPQQQQGSRGIDRSRSAPKPSKAFAHNTVGDKYVTNRAGKDLCRNYQSGECKDTIKGAGGAPVCGRDPSLVHQCELCLGHHPAAPHDGKPCPVGSTAGRDTRAGDRAKGWQSQGQG